MKPRYPSSTVVDNRECRGGGHPGPRFKVAVAVGAAMLALAACHSADGPDPNGNGETPDNAIALTDMGQRTYKGFTGGLYSGGNEPSAAHAAAGLERAGLIQPLDAAGRPDPGGQYVLLSIGMSNTTQEFCSQNSAPPCDAWTFMGKAAADPAVNHSSLVIVNGAAGGQSSDTWDSPTDANYDRVRDTRLAPLGLSELQVEAVWVKVARPQPRSQLPDADADAYVLERDIGNLLRAIRVRYPNVRQAFLSSRVYGGYATTAQNPEPYAYESGFSVKWVIDAQVRQAADGVIADQHAGDLRYDVAAPWAAWGPYLWAAGTVARSDGLTWVRSDFVSDGTHPGRTGEEKVAAMLLAFFKSSPFTRCWFLAAGGGC